MQIGIAGCYVSIDHDGGLNIEKGLVKKQDMKRLTAGDAPQERKPKGMPETLRRDLEAYRLEIARVEIAKHRLIALDLLIFTVASQAFRRAPQSGPAVLFHPNHPKLREQTIAGAAFEAIGKALPLGWLNPTSDAGRFQAFTGLSDAQKLDLLAYCVATTLKPQLSTGNEATAYEVALSLTNAEVSGSWRPAAASYLGRVTREQLLAIGRQVLGEAWAQSRHRDKKGELAAQLERAFAEPEKFGRTPEQVEKLTHWLPDGMAFTAADQPEATTDIAGQAA